VRQELQYLDPLLRRKLFEIVERESRLFQQLGIRKQHEAQGNRLGGIGPECDIVVQFNASLRLFTGEPKIYVKDVSLCVINDSN
jgi:hypothetical protein